MAMNDFKRLCLTLPAWPIHRPNLSLSAALTVLSSMAVSSVAQMIFFCLALHLVWFLLLHIVQAIVVRQTYPIRPPPHPDPWPWLNRLLFSVLLVGFQFDSVLQLLLFLSAFHLVECTKLLAMQAPVVRRVYPSRPPPKPDPSLSVSPTAFDYIVSPVFLVMTVLFGNTLMLHDQVLLLSLGFGLMWVWLTRISSKIGYALNIHANRWSDQGVVMYKDSRGKPKIRSVLPHKACHSHPLEVLFDIVDLGGFISVMGLIILLLLYVSWLLSWLKLGNRPGVSRCLSRTWSFLLFMCIDVPTTCLEFFRDTPDDLSSLARDIEDILSDEFDDDWAVLSREMFVHSLTEQSRRLPRIRRIHPHSMRAILLQLMAWFGTGATATAARPEYVAISDTISMNFGSTTPSLFVPESLSWRERRRLIRWSEAATVTVPDPVKCALSRPSTHLPPSTLVRSSQWYPFFKRFNPASAGMQILLAERMDRALKRGEPQRRKVSVHLETCRSEMLAHSTAWFLPAVDVSVFNSIGDGLGAPLIVDSGASCCITPHREDFVTYHDSKVKVKDLSGTNKVAGEGMVNWNVLDRYGREVLLEMKAYHMPSASVRLLSPQALFKSVKGSDGHQDAEKYTLILPDDMVLEAHYGRANLPLLQLSNSEDSCLWSTCFGFSSSDRLDWSNAITDASNQNLTAAQKEFLVWHFRLSHAGLSTIHKLCRQRRKEKTTSVEELIRIRTGPLLFCTNNVRNAVCNGLLCAACIASKARRRSPSARATIQRRGPEMTLKRNHLKPGDCISCDHYMSPVPGRAIAASGYSSTRHGYNCGTIYVDHASGFITVPHQVSTSAAETIRGKMMLEKEAREVNVSIKAYHSDNGVFSSAEFKSHCEQLGQTLTFCGVGAKFQNEIAERAIQTVCNMARANMIHATMRWPTRPFIDMWPLAMNYAAWVYNRLPSGDNADGLSPEELWSGIRCVESHLPRAHVFGCPVYVLDPKLQEGHDIPKWDSKVRQGIFVGFSPHHSTNVPLIFNPSTQHISPQFHVIFDDEFSTVPGFASDTEWDERFEALFDISREKFVDVDEDEVIPPEIPSDLLSDDWLSPEEILHRNEQRPVPLPSVDSEGGGTLHRNEQCPVPDSSGGDILHRNEQCPVSSSSDVYSEGAAASKGNTVSEGDVISSSRPTRRATQVSWKDGPARDRPSRSSLGLCCLLALPQYALSSASIQPPPILSNVGAFDTVNRPKRVLFSSLNEAALLQGDWEQAGRDACNGINQAHVGIFEPDLADDIDAYTITDVEPHLLKASTKEHDPDSPSFKQAMNSTQADQWWEAAKTEMHTLEEELGAWELVVCTPEMINILPSTWAFKLKRFPDGLTKKFKARFCVRGDQQKAGIDYFETWAPVVQWTTVRTMMVLATKLGLHSAQADITAAFVHAKLADGEDIYVRQPQGFTRYGPNGEELVLKLKLAVYGLKQSPRYFYNHLRKHLELQGLKQSAEDPCLFVGSSLIVLIYVDDLLMFSKDEADFDNLISALKAADISIRREGTAEGFLGVQIERELTSSGPQIKLLQTGLTSRIIQAVGLCSSMSTKIDTPAEASPLPKDSEGALAHEQFNYAAVVGMLLYLSGHSRPDIAFAVHQCARYTFNPKRKHELALIRIGRYLKGTAKEGLVMKPTDSPRLDCYPDADFAGLYGHEDAQDPHCARSRTGYVILAFGCPVLWRSKLQTEIALSTMEAEYVALSTACKDLIPMIALVKELRRAVGLPSSVETNLHCKIHEDNVGALTLANLEPQRMTPRSKHYAIKYHWFRKYVADKSNNVTIVKIDTANQLGDIFTKGLTKVTFVKLRRMLMGW